MDFMELTNNLAAHLQPLKLGISNLRQFLKLSIFIVPDAFHVCVEIL